MQVQEADLLFNVVQHFALGLNEDGHVQEDLVQLHQALLQLLHRLMPLIDLCQSVQHLQSRITVSWMKKTRSTKYAD